MRLMKVSTLFLAGALTLACPAGGALAQQGKGQGRPHPQHMSDEDRQRMRDDMRDAYRDRDRGRPDRQRPMSREERDKLRQDIQDANKQMRR
jgi:hypothetical protein